MVGHTSTLLANLDNNVDQLHLEIWREEVEVEDNIKKLLLSNDPQEHINNCKTQWKIIVYRGEIVYPHLFSSTLDDLPNKWYKIKEA